MTSVSVSVTATKVLRNSVPVHCRALRPSHTGDRRRPAGAARISRGPSVSVLLRLTGRGTEAAAPSGEARDAGRLRRMAPHTGVGPRADAGMHRA